MKTVIAPYGISRMLLSKEQSRRDGGQKIGTAACIHFADLVFPGSELKASEQQALSISELIDKKSVISRF